MDLNHPFTLGHYHLTTTDLRALTKQIRFWVYASIKGAMVMGEKRVGKSYTVEFLLQNMDKVVGQECYAFSVLWKLQTHFNERRFWKRLLGATGFDTTLPGDPDRLENRFYKRIKLATEAAGAPVCFLIIDEAQNVSPTEFLFLCHLFNELEKRKIRVYTLLFGQNELEHTRTLMEEANHGQVIARFMQHSFHMRGISSARSLKMLLNQLDKLGYTRDAVGEAFDADFKLADIAAPLWNAKKEVNKTRAESIDTPWTMQTFQAVLAVILQHLSRRGGSSSPMTEQDFQEIIELVHTEAVTRDDD